MIPLVSRIAWTPLMALLMAYQLAAQHFRWTPVSRLWPWNAVVFLGLLAHFLDEYLQDAFAPTRDFS